MNNKRTTNVGNPVDTRDAVNLNYVTLLKINILSNVSFANVSLRVIYMRPYRHPTNETYFNMNGVIIGFEGR